MVFFTCNACGQSVKKAQVEKHYMTQCRNCEVLSCMDCGKDFVGDAYKEHTKCVSENEKYGGKDYKPPRSKGNKGEAKQEQWLQHVREAKDSAKLSPAVSQLLDRIAGYPNVPRKKAKFENFVYNSLRVSNRSLVEQVWNIFSEAGVNYYKDLSIEASKQNSNSKESKPSKDNSSTDTKSKSTDQSQDVTTNQSTDSQLEPSENTNQSQGSKKKKKKKKDKGKKDDTDDVANGEKEVAKENDVGKVKRKKRQDDPEVLLSEENDIVSRTEQDDSQTLVKKHKKRKSKDKQIEEGALDADSAGDGVRKDKKKKKKHGQEMEEQVSKEEELQVQLNGKPKKKKHKKHQEEETEEMETSSGKRKRRLDDEEEENNNCTTEKMLRLDDSTVENGEELSKPKKFKWDKVIMSVLQNCSDHQLPLKKLRKKVLNEYHACGGDVRIKTNEQLRATFEKKVNKNPNIKVHKEVVKLIS